MVNRIRLLSAAALLGGILAASAYAQDVNPPAPDSAPANLAYVEGDVVVVHDALIERVDAPLMLVDGDIVRTRSGRAEIIFTDGTILHLNQDTELEILAPERVRLLTGRVLIRVSAAVTRRYFVDTPTATVRLEQRGEYGITTDQRTPVEVTVARGTAEIDDGTQRVLIRAGEMASLDRAGARPLFQPFNSARWDAFAQWANDRVNGFTNSRSAAQLPSELRPYAPMLDEYGRWDHLAPYGYVWFPSVSASWRPYYEGSWAHTRYGWTWYGRDRWAWPTHHFGRWGFNGSFWYWIPAKVWGPAWVTWGFAPGFVSWSPLGWDGGPAIRFWQRRDHPAYTPHYSPWRAWTIVPRDHFGRRPVRPHAIDGERLDEPTRRAMVLQNRSPSAPANLAVPRGSLSVPGMSGNVRRDGIRDERPGNVRRPETPPPAGASTPSPTMSGSTIRTPSSSRQRGTDDPAYAPPQLPTIDSGSSQRRGDTNSADNDGRRGSVRYPASGYPAPSSRSERPVVTAPPDTGERPVVTAPPDTGAQPREAGAQPRGTSRGLSQPSEGSRGTEAGRMSGRDSSSNSGGSSGRSGSVREATPRSAPPPPSSSGGSSEGASSARPRGGASGSQSSGTSSGSTGSSGSAAGAAGGAVRRPPR